MSVTLLHDPRYTRKPTDPANIGSEYPLPPVRRIGDFLATLLPQIGLGDRVKLTTHVMPFTIDRCRSDQI